MNKRLYWLLAVCGLVILLTTQEGQSKQIVGWLENIRLSPEGLLIRAKVDTGAKTASLSAEEIKEFTHNGQNWIRFKVTNRRGETATFERPIYRMAKIKRHFERSQKRPVVLIGICMGGIHKQTEVNLIDRTGFNYQMLIGRTFLQGDFMIDPALKHTVSPQCEEAHQ
ncbi:MAG: RimK/LysX family protein [Gammaproteobacteria bacterium]|nr:RimK/LysX family protein [Gammaproteobacteria bacterium]